MKRSGVQEITSNSPQAHNGWLWAAQIILAALFLFAGAMKFIVPVQQLTKGSSLPGAFFQFIGVMEILGAIGLVLPWALHIAPVLTPLAASGLAIIMIGATVISLPMRAFALIPLTIGVIAVLIAYSRFRSVSAPRRH